MPRSFLLIIVIALRLATSLSAETHAGHGAGRIENNAQTRFTCLMHPQVVLEHPGNCPICGMPLVALKSPGEAHQAAGHGHHAESSAAGHTMNSSIDLADPMTRESSGTSWLPDSSPMHALMLPIGNDSLMVHGEIFPRYTFVSSNRGDDRVDAPNWFMGMYSHLLGDNTQLGARLMMSLDPLTEQGRGYPLLLQTGESWHDEPMHDRQHPHDLFDELSLSLSQRINSDISGYLYFGYPGEPALGPPTFMHRPSAMDNPDAPIGHHWQDSTHVTFGVATAGLETARFGGLKIEGSVFTGREPDESRYDFDQPRFDSYSGRISWNPCANLALQLSHGWIESPEALEPEVNRHRTTASAVYNLPLGRESNWASTFVWGRNNDSGEKTQSFLLESNYQRDRTSVYLRWERVEKSGHELVLRPADSAAVFAVHAASLGFVHDFSLAPWADVGAGAQFTLDFWPNELNRYYGSGPGYGVEVFLRIRPPLHRHE